MSTTLTAARLYLIAHDSSLEFDDKIQVLLQLGIDTFGLTQATVSHHLGRELVMEYVAPREVPLKPGTVMTLSRTYCDITLKLRYTLAIDNMLESAHRAHPCYRELGVETYFGTPLIVNGELYGTLNFTAPRSRGALFTPEDKAQLELLGTVVASLLAQRQILAA
ncbi:MAG: GAF domain-containing protein [Anaerolineae bacterium]|nr:GAF domain-containing protein [Anaerolineae bacterium]